MRYPMASSDCSVQAAPSVICDPKAADTLLERDGRTWHRLTAERWQR